MKRGKAEARIKTIEAAAEIKSDSPLTVRQMFYKLVSSGLIENTPQAYHRLAAALRET